MIKLETTVILVSMLLSFILGVLLGGVLIYSKMCASEIHYFWKSQKEVILNQFDIKGEQ